MELKKVNSQKINDSIRKNVSKEAKVHMDTSHEHNDNVPVLIWLSLPSVYNSVNFYWHWNKYLGSVVLCSRYGTNTVVVYSEQSRNIFQASIF
jgi:hypothetical protein